jgi:hypothetical protein
VTTAHAVDLSDLVARKEASRKKGQLKASTGKIYISGISFNQSFIISQVLENYKTRMAAHYLATTLATLNQFKAT